MRITPITSRPASLGIAAPAAPMLAAAQETKIHAHAAVASSWSTQAISALSAGGSDAAIGMAQGDISNARTAIGLARSAGGTPGQLEAVNNAGSELDSANALLISAQAHAVEQRGPYVWMVTTLLNAVASDLSRVTY
jgi:hypothetical protein